MYGSYHNEAYQIPAFFSIKALYIKALQVFGIGFPTHEWPLEMGKTAWCPRIYFPEPSPA
jgi:hypothetical protein